MVRLREGAIATDETFAFSNRPEVVFVHVFPPSVDRWTPSLSIPA
jgi:hypothetical protein